AGADAGGEAEATGATSAPQPVQKRWPAKTGVAQCRHGAATGAPHAAKNRAPAGRSAWQRAQVIGVRTTWEAGFISRWRRRWQALPVTSAPSSTGAARRDRGPCLAASPWPAYNHRLFCVLTFKSRAQGPARRQLRFGPVGALRRCLHVSDLQRRRSPRNKSSSMPTITQLVRHGRETETVKSKSPA